ncbi:hypothetical protein NQ318_009275 [Aromia moschata]|uniref:THAP-type domain-containing protein n=1 Tax=Aromia moschata TaxID=1265417 RepID=A0AAV8YI28_9CUCU|nr:hypothetical protein NQ318_009275 [Aromia moschata]
MVSQQTDHWAIIYSNVYLKWITIVVYLAVRPGLRGIPNNFIYFLNKESIKFPLVNKFGQKERIDRRKAWILQLSIGKPVSKFMKVCSLHFAEKDYIYPSKDSKNRKILKKTAVPSNS